MTEGAIADPGIGFNPQISQITQMTNKARWWKRNLSGSIPRCLRRGSLSGAVNHEIYGGIHAK